MTNAMFAFGKESLLGGDLAWDTQAINLVCVDHTDDTPVPATDQNLDDILAAARVAISGDFTGKSITGGVADATDVVLTSVSGDEFESVVVFYDSTVESTSILICYIDTATGLPCTPNGGNITVAWSDGASKIFAI